MDLALLGAMLFVPKVCWTCHLTQLLLSTLTT